MENRRKQERLCKAEKEPGWGALRMCQQLQGGQGKKAEHTGQSTEMAEDEVREWEEEITWGLESH